jgi:hypothetical protein
LTVGNGHADNRAMTYPNASVFQDRYRNPSNFLKSRSCLSTRAVRTPGSPRRSHQRLS